MLQGTTLPGIAASRLHASLAQVSIQVQASIPQTIEVGLLARPRVEVGHHPEHEVLEHAARVSGRDNEEGGRRTVRSARQLQRAGRDGETLRCQMGLNALRRGPPIALSVADHRQRRDAGEPRHPDHRLDPAAELPTATAVQALHVDAHMRRHGIEETHLVPAFAQHEDAARHRGRPLLHYRTSNPASRLASKLSLSYATASMRPLCGSNLRTLSP